MPYMRSLWTLNGFYTEAHQTHGGWFDGNWDMVGSWTYVVNLKGICISDTILRVDNHQPKCHAGQRNSYTAMTCNGKSPSRT